ncbi:C-5 cytosine-specific DNA methylase [compost metagenome]
MASPTCTHHSVARGGKPTSDQQRSDPWHIITWLTELRVKRIIIENVWEFTGWGPVDPKTMRPIANRKGEYFHAWIETLKRLGYDPEWRKLNAADYGDATTRSRFILMARNDGRRVAWPNPTHHKRPDEGLALFPTLKPWKAAREIIDWDIKGRSIFNRKKQLAPKTLARIYAGAVKHSWPEPYLVILRNHMSAQGVDQPVPTIAANGLHIGLAQPMLLANRTNNVAKDPATSPVPCLTTAPGGGIAVIEPFVLSQASGGSPRAVSNPIPTQTTGGNGAAHALISPYYGSGSGETCTSADEVLPTVTTKARFGMVVPVTNKNGGPGPRTCEEPLPTMTTAKGGEFAVVLPVTHEGGLNRVRDASEPLPTVTGANRGELAFVTAQFGEREGQAPRVHDIDQPAPTGLTLGKGGLIEGVEGYDILFRMLEPHELAAAMGFTTEDQAYEFAGTKTDQIKQIGNAVSVAKMKACVGSLMADAVPRARAKPKTSLDRLQEEAA